MNRNERVVILILVVLLALGFLFFRSCSAPKPPAMPPLVAPNGSTGTAVRPSPIPSTAAAHPPVTTPPVTKPHAAEKPKAAPAKVSSTDMPAPPKLELHKELIPKNIEIVRCYYEQQIAPPGTTIGFDLNGSGFTQEFQQMIKVESGKNDIAVQNLKLVTANQIHGELVVGPNAATDFVFPRVLIKGLPVFTAPEPFGVVRKGEVLTVIFISMEGSGRAGRFRVITNLDDDLFKQFRIEPSTAGLTISDIQPSLPYKVEGTLRIQPGVPPGSYGMTIFVGDKAVFRRDGMIRIVRPNVGQSGFVQGIIAENPYHRPGDAIDLYLQGTGMRADDLTGLQGKVDEFDMGRATFTYISGTQVRCSFSAPPQTAPGSYSVTVSGPNGQVLYQKKNAFTIVPPNWVGGVQVVPQVQSGGHSQLRILGRDFSTDYAAALHMDVDESGIHIEPPTRADASTIVAGIEVSTAVAPGDYWVHLSAGGKKIDPPYGSIIKVQPAP